MATSMHFPANPVLRRVARRLVQAIRPSGVVLLYHRLGDGRDPFRNAVTPEHFSSHLEMIRRHTAPVSLQAMMGEWASGKVARSTVAVTFDDGYSSTLEIALPLLERYEIPATVFIVPGMVGQHREFWWDQLEFIFSSSKSGHAEIYRYHTELMHANNTAKNAILTRLWMSRGLKPSVRASHQPMQSDQIRKLAQSPLIEIGAHTMTHPVLTRLDTASQSVEIAESRRVIERMTNVAPAAFSYPHGAYDQETINHVRGSGFRYACCSTPQSIRSLNCRYSVPRFAVPDCDAKTFSSKLEGWLAAPGSRRTGIFTDDGRF